MTIFFALLLAHFCATAQSWRDSVWRADVMTVRLYRTGAELSCTPPVLTTGRQEGLTLEFDILRAEPEALHWKVRHCDRHWRPDNLEPYEFMTGFDEGAVDEYEFSFTTLHDYVHYKAKLFGSFTEFFHSGNYLLTVSLDSSPDSILLTRRFCVSEESAGCTAVVTRPFDGMAVDRRQQVDVSVGGNFQEQYLDVAVQQNGRLDNMRFLEMSGYDGNDICFRNRNCNIFDGGNTFRFFDCSNLHSPMYNMVRVEEYGGQQFVILRPEEDRSKKHYLSEKGLMGGMKVNIWDRNNPTLEADYVWVNFSLPMAQPMLDGRIYIVGDLTGWRLDESSYMDYNPKLRAYTKRLLLKQGYYSYQLLVLPTYPATQPFSHSATQRLEGDHRETPNLYTVYVYYRSPSDRADRLIRVKKLQ